MGLYVQIMTNHLSQHRATLHGPVSSTWAGFVRPLSTGKLTDFA